MITRSKAGIHKPKHPICLSATHQSSSSFSSPAEPTTYTQASKSPVWVSAMIEEFQALQNQSTWCLVPLPSHKTAIGCKWVFKIKHNSDGSVARHKARLVAKGYLQQEGIDFYDTFSPVAKQPTIRVLISMALHFNWPMKQLDISNAFLHGTLEEEVYMVQPPGFVDSSKPTHVCKLQKALYGLKQAPRAWYSTFSNFLEQQGFRHSNCDTSLFVRKTANSITILLIYVDDILLTGSNTAYIQSLLSQMHLAFSMKELGTVNYFLGISVQSTANGCFLSQKKYASELLHRAGMTDCKPSPSPIAIKSSTFSPSNQPYSQPSFYRSIVGALQYLTITRPDIALAENMEIGRAHV